VFHLLPLRDLLRLLRTFGPLRCCCTAYFLRCARVRLLAFWFCVSLCVSHGWLFALGLAFTAVVTGAFHCCRAVCTALLRFTPTFADCSAARGSRATGLPFAALPWFYLLRYWFSCFPTCFTATPFLLPESCRFDTRRGSAHSGLHFGSTFTRRTTLPFACLRIYNHCALYAGLTTVTRGHLISLVRFACWFSLRLRFWFCGFTSQLVRFDFQSIHGSTTGSFPFTLPVAAASPLFGPFTLLFDCT